MNTPIVVAGVSAATTVSAGIAWRLHPRAGTRFVNRVIDPFLVGHGLAGAGRSELGTLEHIGRRSGVVRLTPVHPVTTPDGVRIIVPLGWRSEWARNVVAAGHCRLQLHDTVMELDEPILAHPARVRGISWFARWSSRLLGFQYLTLHAFATRAGTLADGITAAPEMEAPAAVA